MRWTTIIGRRTSSRALAAIAVGAALLSAACDDDVTGPSDLDGIEWRLQEMRLASGETFTPSDPRQFTVTFGADGSVGMRVDCNVCGGRYSLSGDTLQVSEMVCTLAFCATAPRDQQYLSLLDGSTTLDADDDELEIRSARGTLEFSR